MNVDDVYRAVRSFVSNHDHKFQNVYVHAWEADHFSMTTSNYTYEIEVKVSRSDFFADFKKPKHNFFKGYKSGYGILRGDESWTKSNDMRYCDHPDLLGYEIRWTHLYKNSKNNATL